MCFQRQEKDKITLRKSLFASWFKHFCTIRFIFVFSWINTRYWFRASCLLFSIYGPQSNKSLIAALFSQTTNHILSILWTWRCFSFLTSLPFLSPSRWFIPAPSFREHFHFPHILACLEGKGKYWDYQSMLTTEAKRLLHPLRFLSDLFCSFAAFLHTYSISLQSIGRSHLRRRLQPQIRRGRPEVTWPLGGLKILIFRWWHFKLMFQITRWPRREVASGWVSNWQPQCLLTAPPAFEELIRTCT